MHHGMLRDIFFTCSNPIIHVPQKLCIGILLDFSWDIFVCENITMASLTYACFVPAKGLHVSREISNNDYANFFGGWGGSEKSCILGLFK